MRRARGNTWSSACAWYIAIVSSLWIIYLAPILWLWMWMEIIYKKCLRPKLGSMFGYVWAGPPHSQAQWRSLLGHPNTSDNDDLWFRLLCEEHFLQQCDHQLSSCKTVHPPPQRKIDDIFFPVTNNTITTNLKHTSICLSPQLGDSGLHLSILS